MWELSHFMFIGRQWTSFSINTNELFTPPDISSCPPKAYFRLSKCNFNMQLSHDLTPTDKQDYARKFLVSSCLLDIGNKFLSLVKRGRQLSILSKLANR